MSQTTITKIADIGGVAYQFDEGYVLAVPVDGEWMFGKGSSLDDVLDAIENSDGLALEEDGVVVRPFLELQEALEEMETYTDGAHTVLVNTAITPSLTT